MAATTKDLGPSNAVARGGAVRLTGAAYKFESLLLHAARSESPELWQRLIQRLERDDFLARQAELPDGFEICARQLERHVLPALVELRDWERFLQYLLTAANLRALSSSLDDPAILQALARSGRLRLAEALVARLPRPADRARGYGVLCAEQSPDEPAFDRLTNAFSRELERLPQAQEGVNEGEARRWCSALATAGRLLGPHLRARWSAWIDRLSPWTDLADEVRLAVAEGLFDAGEPEASELWEVLGQVQSHSRLLDLLCEWLPAAGCGDLQRWLGLVRTRLPQVASDPRIPWRVGLALLARCDGDRVEAWRRLQEELAPPGWDADLLQVGAAFWPRLPVETLQSLAAELGTPELQARLQVLVLEGRRDEGSFEAGLSVQPAIEDPTLRRSLYLRSLAAAPPHLSRMVRGRLREVLAHFASIQYAVPASDLRIALDLVARHLPRRLRRTVDGVLAAPESGPETLRTLAQDGQEEGLLQELFDRAESYAAMAAGNAAEGFELRGEILALLACRLIRRRGDLQAFDVAAERLLPEEEDGLRAAAARVLGPGARDLAETLCAGIHDRRLQLQVRLEILPEGADPKDLVSPGALYRAAVKMEAVEDELQALGGFLQEPRQPARLAEHFEGMRSLGRRVETLADLAHHSLRFQARRLRPARQDRLAAVLPLKEALGVVESDTWLISLTPELVTIGGHLGPREAVAEVQEAFERVAELESVSPQRREEVLIDLVSRIEALLLDEGSAAPLAHVPCVLRDERAAELVTWLARFPERAGDTAAGQLVRQRWHRLLPCITAVGERLEPQPRSWLRLLPWAVRFWPPPRSILATAARHGPEWAPGHEEVFRLCAASVEERIERSDRILEGLGDRPDPDVLRALAWLLSREAAERVPSILACMDAGPGRDRTVLELLRSGLLPVDVQRHLVALLSPEDGSREWGRVWLGVREPSAMAGSEWLSAAAALVAQDRLDPGDPGTAPVRRRLWALNPDEGISELADAALRGLALGGQAAGERAARLFLHLYVQPRLGERAPEESWRRHAEMQRALERARSLEAELGQESEPSHDDETARDDSDSAASTGLLERYRRWTETWSRRSHHLGEERAHDTKGLAFLTGIAALPVLPQFQAVLLGWEAVPQVGPRAAAGILLVLGLVVLANAVLFGRYLAWATPRERSVRRPIRWVRTALVAIPVFGLWTIPAWRWLLAERDHWLRGNDPHEHPGWLEVPPRSWPMPRDRLSGSPGRLARWAGRRSAWVALFLGNVAALTGVARASGGIELVRRPMIAGAFVLHALFFACMLAGLVLWVRDRRFLGWRALVLPALSVCWLVPVPALPLLGLLALIFLDSEIAEASLSSHAFRAGRGVGRFPRWLRLEGRLRRSWPGTGWRSRLRGLPEAARRQPEPTQAERRLLWLFQGKGAALFFESAWLGGLLGTAIGGGPSQEGGLLGGLFSSAQGLSLVLGAIGLVGLGISFSREILQPETGSRVFGPRLFWGHFAGTQCALWLGLELGAGLSGSDLARAAGALLVVGLGGAVLQVGALVVGLVLQGVPERPWEDGVEYVLKVLVYVGAGACGLQLLSEGPEASRFLPRLGAYRLAAPVFGALLGLWGLRWLISPEVRGRFRSGALPLRSRLRFLLLVATAVVPLGGLAVPWWIRMNGPERQGSGGCVLSQPPGSRASRSPSSSSPSSLPSR